MKIRNGFVSNSSSSSFVALAPRVEWQVLMDKLSPVEVASVETLVEDSVFCGIACINYSYTSGNYNSLEDMDFSAIKKRAKEIAVERNIVLTEEDLDTDTIRDAAYEVAYQMRRDLKALGDKAFVSQQEF